MKFTPRELGDAAEASSGGGRRGMAAEFGKVLLLAIAAMGVLWLVFAALSELAVRAISPQQEAEMLRLLAPNLDLWEPESPEDKARAEMIAATLQRLQNLPEVPDLPYTLVFLEMEEPNAFAFPGGAIGISRGLLEALGDEEVAYAFVLGHELGHFKNRDHLKGLIRDAGAMFAISLLFGGADLSRVATSTTGLVSMGYSRSQEYAADDFGIALVRQLYGNTAGAEKLFQVLTEDEEHPPWAYMFSTHPDPLKRIQRVQQPPE